jgi:hypothetical protein
MATEDYSNARAQSPHQIRQTTVMVLSLTDAYIQETFDMLGLNDEAKRHELQKLKSVASACEQEACWISSHNLDERGSGNEDYHAKLE